MSPSTLNTPFGDDNPGPLGLVGPPPQVPAGWCSWFTGIDAVILKARSSNEPFQPVVVALCVEGNSSA